MPRPIAFAGLLRSLAVLAFLLVAVVASAEEAEETDLAGFAQTIGIEDVETFVATVSHLQETGDLPEPYISKDEAEALGWEPGRDLCEVAPGAVLGDNHFGNYEGRLPDASGRRWRSADIDVDCGRRGARRLVYSNDGLVFFTLDHYETFHEVPD